LYILKKLAYWIHTQGSTGETEGGTLIDKDELIRWLRKEIQTLKKCEAHEAKGEAERFIDFIQRRTGLLNEQGRDRYAFVHKTFQEYLTAEEIFDRADVEDDTEIILDHFRQHLHDQHWREVLLLLVSKLKGKKAQKAIQAVLDAGSEYEQWLHRDLLFAGWCLTEDPPELTVVAQEWVRGILDRLVKLELKSHSRIGVEVKSEVAKIIHCFGETTLEKDVWAKLQVQKDRVDRFRLISFQASLGQEADAINTLLNSLENQHGAISLISVDMLVQLGNKNEKLMSCLLRLVKSEQQYIYLHAAKILVRSGKYIDEMMQHFLFMLDSQDSFARIGAAQILVQLGNTGDHVVTRLLSLLKDENSYVRCNAASTLGPLGSVNPDVMVSGLLSLLKDENSHVRCNAASTLGPLGSVNPDVMNHLLDLLGDKYPPVRGNAASALGASGNRSSEVINRLLALLRDEDLDVCSNAASALVQLGNTNYDVSRTLLALVCDEKSFAHPRAVEALVQLSKTSDTIVPELVRWLEQNRNEDVMGNAIDCLWSIVVE
jgi:hypothetical protein